MTAPRGSPRFSTLAAAAAGRPCLQLSAFGSGGPCDTPLAVGIRLFMTLKMPETGICPRRYDENAGLASPCTSDRKDAGSPRKARHPTIRNPFYVCTVEATSKNSRYIAVLPRPAV